MSYEYNFYYNSAAPVGSFISEVSQVEIDSNFERKLTSEFHSLKLQCESFNKTF